MSVFNQKYLPGFVLRCPMAAENRSYDQGGGGGWPPFVSSVQRRAHHKHFVVILCEQRTTDAAVSARRLPPFVKHLLSQLCFLHFATRTVDNTVDMYAAKPDIRPELCFLPITPAFHTPLWGVPVGVSPPHLVWKN